MTARDRIWRDVQKEIERQDTIWGEQNPPDFVRLSAPERAAFHGIPTETEAKHLCEQRHASGNGTWADILVEEVAEAVASENRYDLRQELVQVAAVAHQWIAALDRRIDSTESVLEQQEWDDRAGVS